MRVWFDHAAELMTKGDALQGFEIAGDDGHFVSAKARLDGNTVVLSDAQCADAEVCALRLGERTDSEPV
jgi:hypothetical protein